MSKPILDTFDCSVLAPGWRLHLACLVRNEQREMGNVMDVAVRGAEATLAREFPAGRLRASATVAAIRDHLLRLGIAPRAHPPCSEILLRRFLDAGAIPRGSVAWEFLAVLTVKSHAPWAVIDRRSLAPPLAFRPARADENPTGEDGQTSGEELPLLADGSGGRISPWRAPQPGELTDVVEPVFVCFLPSDLFRSVAPRNHLGRTMWLTWAYRFVFERTCRHRQR